MNNQLTLAVESIAPVSGQAAEDYRNKQNALRHYVDEQLASQNRLDQLLGGNLFQLLSDNHLHHVRFMSNVFLFNSYSMLCRVIPWVYRAYHKQGIHYEYFSLALQKWQEAVRLFLEPQSAEQILPVYNWMLRHHENFIAAVESSVEVTFPFNLELGPFQQSCLEKLLTGDYESFSRLALQSLNNEKDLGRIYVEVLQPCLYEVGRLWESGNISVAQEHLSTAVVNRTMFQALAQCSAPQKTKGKVVVSAAPNEFHEVGAHMVADLLLLDGWEIIYLGANMPQQDLLDLLCKETPFMLGIAAVLPFHLEYVHEIVAKIRSTSELHNLKVMVGGLAFSHSRDLWKTIGADAYALDGMACVQIAREWWEQSSDEILD